MANGVFQALDALPVASEAWGMKFKALSERVTHHMNEEDVFPMAKKIIKADMAKVMGEWFDGRKRVVLAALQRLDVKGEMEKA